MAYVGLNFGVEGGGSPTGATAKNLQNQLTNIINHVNNSLPKIQITWDTKGINTFQNRLEQLTNVARREANNIQSAYQNIQFPNIPPDPPGGGGNNRNPFAQIVRRNNLLARTENLMRSINNAQDKWDAAGRAGSSTEQTYGRLATQYGELHTLADRLRNDAVTFAEAEVILSRVNAQYREAQGLIAGSHMDFSEDARNKKLIEAQKELKKMQDNLRKWNAAGDTNAPGNREYQEYAGLVAELRSQINSLSSGRSLDDFISDFIEIKTRAEQAADAIHNVGMDHSRESGFKDFTEDLKKVNTLINETEANLKKWSLAAITDEDNYNDLQRMVEALKDLRNSMLEEGRLPNKFNERFAEIAKGVELYSGRLKKSNKDAQTFGDWVFSKVGEVSKYIDVMDFVYKAVEYGKKMVDAVTEIDTAMTELRKVTDETNVSYNAFLEEASSRAQNLGTSVSNVVSASADFARLGYDLDEASSLADAAIVYKNVGDGINDIDTASSSIISTMQAFNIEASDAMSIVDSFNNVGNNFAISSAGIGEALLNSAAALSAANNDLHESIALIAAAICIGSLCSNA